MKIITLLFILSFYKKIAQVNFKQNAPRSGICTSNTIKEKRVCFFRKYLFLKFAVCLAVSANN